MIDNSLPVGSIVTYGGSVLSSPIWKICDGSSLLKSNYPELFAQIGYTYSTNTTGDTFNLPDMRGKVAVGYQSEHSMFGDFGETVGEDSHTLTEAELPKHNHRFYEWGIIVSKNGNTGTIGTSTGSKLNIMKDDNDQNRYDGYAGNNFSHNNVQRSLVCNYIIKVKNNTSELPTVEFNGTVSQIENTSHKSTTITSSSTDTEYPTAKAVYDYIQLLLGGE